MVDQQKSEVWICVQLTWCLPNSFLSQ